MFIKRDFIWTHLFVLMRVAMNFVTESPLEMSIYHHKTITHCTKNHLQNKAITLQTYVVCHQWYLWYRQSKVVIKKVINICFYDRILIMHITPCTLTVSKYTSNCNMNDNKKEWRRCKVISNSIMDYLTKKIFYEF